MVGGALTVTVTDPAAGYDVPPEDTDVNVYVAVTVGDTFTVALPAPLRVTEAVAPVPPFQ